MQFDHLEQPGEVGQVIWPIFGGGPTFQAFLHGWACHLGVVWVLFTP